MPDTVAFLLTQAQASSHIQFVYDLTDQQVTYVNEAYEHVLGGNRASVNDAPPALLARLHPDDKPVLGHYWRMWVRGQLQDEVELRLLVPDQPEQWFCLTPHWHQEEGGHILLRGVLKDISASKRHQNTVDKFNTKKNTVLKILSHDLSGTFRMLQQLSAYVEEQMRPQFNPKVLEMLRLMGTTSQQSVELIDNLINQEFQESAEVDMKWGRIDLAERVAQILEPFRRAPAHQGRKLSYELPQAPVYARVDANKIMQVISNLVHNAYKFTPASGHISVKLTPSTGYVRISIADEGIGIPAHLMSGLFERYTTAGRPGLLGEPTKGLGLWLCKTIVKLHHGMLSVVSTEGKGSTFTVELPA